MSTTFEPGSFRRFRFSSLVFDETSSTAQLGYALESTTGGDLSFIEQIRFPTPSKPLLGQRRAAFDAVLRLLHLVAGMSYYKAAAPPELVVEGPAIGEATAGLLREIYLNGLGEYAYRNGLDLDPQLHFPCISDGDNKAVDLTPTKAALVAIGGGKDSLVSVEAIRSTGRPAATAIVGSSPVIHQVAAATGLEVVTVTRRLAPELLEINRAGALNGHVAITAIVGCILLAAAILRGDGAVVLSNERSASEGNSLRIGKLEINHQYSKSAAFETAFTDHLRRHVVSGVHWFSLLRPLSELAICRRFAELTKYHQQFTSCNNNFKISDLATSPRWCLECPKCHFVHLALAPFLNPRQLQSIFGANLFETVSYTPEFARLMGGEGEPKPFECVGTFDEARAAVVLLSQRPEYARAPVIRRLLADHPSWFEHGDRLVELALSPAAEHLVPSTFKAELDALL